MLNIIAMATGKQDLQGKTSEWEGIGNISSYSWMTFTTADADSRLQDFHCSPFGLLYV